MSLRSNVVERRRAPGGLAALLAARQASRLDLASALRAE